MNRSRRKKKPSCLSDEEKRMHDVEDEIVFLGTGGARYVIAKQLRATGGILFRMGNKEVLVDPGPESLYRLHAYVPDLAPEKIDAIILTHKHIDHSADVNVYLDVMTRGGLDKRGTLLAPGDAFGEYGVVYKYLLQFIDRAITIKEGSDFALGDLNFHFPIKHEHRVETYGFKLSYKGITLSYITDTKFFNGLVNAYKSDIVIMNLIKLGPSEIDHLSVDDCAEIISGIKPKVAIITHFGMTMIRTGPWNVARQLKERTGITVLAAEDGKHYPIAKLLGSNLYFEHI
ncbi:MAG: MBL fold metallo-hydrolase [candidate division WOR-3 bacterium]|nr:MAG: MBL fold metallo-hydrolase [candidate division WOR-3 bacterium]